MKTVLSLVFVTLIVAVVAWDESHNGRPCCKSNEEMTQKFWRNNFDSTVYFECEKLNEPATTRRCEDQFMFLSTQGKCVSMQDWSWVEPVDAPSKC